MWPHMPMVIEDPIGSYLYWEPGMTSPEPKKLIISIQVLYSLSYLTIP